MSARLLVRRTYDAADLARRHPPRWRHPHKIAIAEKLSGLPLPAGTVDATRWAPAPRDPRLPDARPAVEIRADHFTYEPDPGAWHLNFADGNLFCGYASSLFAQDELQVLEHPILASVLEAWLFEGIPARTFDEENPTPVLVRGAERRIAFDVGAGEGSLYGGAFGRAPVDSVLRAAHPIEPPTSSNILAIEAPNQGLGRYSRDTLRFVIETAATGFAAARAETSPASCTIHTGFWGCGVYGGNRAAMTQLQLLAARVAGIPRIVFHAGAAPEIALDAIAQLEQTRAWNAAGASELDVVEAIFEFAHEWGEGDGN
jgi:hypothetical protein